MVPWYRFLAIRESSSKKCVNQVRDKSRESRVCSEFLAQPDEQESRDESVRVHVNTPQETESW